MAGYVQIIQQQKEELRIDGRYSRGDNDNETRSTKLSILAQGAPVELPIELTLNEIDQSNGNLSIQTDYFAQSARAAWTSGTARGAATRTTTI